MSAARRRQVLLCGSNQLSERQSGGFISSLLAPLAVSTITLLKQVLLKQTTEHAKKMALFEPPLLDSLCDI